jgi:hypothetical protein
MSNYLAVKFIHIVTFIPIAKQRAGKHILAIQEHENIEGHQLLGNGPLSTHS